MFALLLILGIGFGYNQRTGRSVHFGKDGLHVKTAHNERCNKVTKGQVLFFFQESLTLNN